MIGVIVHLNHQKGLYSVELSDGSYSIFELLDSNELNSDDVIVGTLNELGSCVLKNQTEDEQFDAFIENTGLNFQAAQQMIY